MAVEGTLARVVEVARSDRGAQRAFWAALVPALILLVVVGRHQWFIRDDWAFLFTRERMRTSLGVDDWLLAPQDGHWMTWPILVYRFLQAVFGIGSYWPYIAVLWATHLGIVLLVRQICRRLEVSAWTTTLICTVLLVFGGGWENIVFAIQITYNFSMLAFLGQLLLVDHDGPVDRRDAIGSVIAVFGVSSSGFGPFFAFGVTVLLVARRRWRAAAVAVVPQAIAWSWWWLTWGADPAGEQGERSITSVIRFARIGLEDTFASLTGSGLLAGTAALAALAVAVWSGAGTSRRTWVIALWATTLSMYLGVGLQRTGLGIQNAGASRYQYVAAMVIAPALAIALDQAHRFAPWARWVPRLVLIVAIGRNAMWLSDSGGNWAQLAKDERVVFSLVAGSPQRGEVDPALWMTEFSPDVRVGDLAELVADGAITPRTPVTPAEQAIVAAALANPRP